MGCIYEDNTVGHSEERDDALPPSLEPGGTLGGRKSEECVVERLCISKPSCAVSNGHVVRNSRASPRDVLLLGYKSTCVLNSFSSLIGCVVMCCSWVSVMNAVR